MTSQGYQERNRGGRYLKDPTGNRILYDHKNTLLNKTDVVWVVLNIGIFPQLDSIWYEYDKAFDQAEKIGGYLDRCKVRRS